MKKRLILLITMTVLLLVPFFYSVSLHNTKTYQVTTQKKASEKRKISNQIIKKKQTIGLHSINEEKKCRVLATGDIMFHSSQLKNAYDEQSQTYQFRDMYEPMKKYFDQADFIVGNFETTSNSNLSYAGYPQFNTPPEAIEALKKIGFNALSTSNNHCLDTGLTGVKTTIEALDRYDMKHFGTTNAPHQSKSLITEVNGIKIAFLSYTESFNGLYNVYLTDETNSMVNPLDMEQVTKDITEIKKDADLVIIYPHWGIEYDTKYNEDQEVVALKMFEAGADVVLGSHPHVLQEAKWYQVNGANKFIIYSMANSIADQQTRYTKDFNTECGVFVQLDIIKKEDGSTSVVSVDLIPTYISDPSETTMERFTVYPIRECVGEGEFANLFDDSVKEKLYHNIEQIQSILTEQYKR